MHTQNLQNAFKLTILEIQLPGVRYKNMMQDVRFRSKS